jgi:hypothetical protein
VGAKRLRAVKRKPRLSAVLFSIPTDAGLSADVYSARAPAVCCGNPQSQGFHPANMDCVPVNPEVRRSNGRNSGRA